MPVWFSHPKAIYVLAAYGVTGFGWIALLFFSWRGLAKRKAEWAKIERKRP